MGPPSLICLRKMGITLPLLPSTLPNRTAAICILHTLPRVSTTISAKRLLAPITLAGFTALSVETNTNRFTPARSHSSTVLSVPNTLFFTASVGAISIMGTCLYAAA